MEGLLFQATVYLAAAVVAVPVANRLGLGSVLGYLIAGVVIGPVLGLVGAETEHLRHYAEFGVVMMLFLIGLELDPRALWAMRTRLFGLGGLQIGLTTLAVAIAAIALGQPLTVALAVGLVLALSSTAIVMQTLDEKGLQPTEGGRSAFSVLLAQDIAVIPMLAIIPLLAMPELMHATPHEGDGHAPMSSMIDGLPGWAVTLIVLGTVGAIVAGGHYLTRPIFRFIAHAHLQEIFTAAALLLVVSIALAMNAVGLSPALGTFLAGVVLANSEYRHELESNIAPFKGLLLGLFFITVGAGIDFGLLFGTPMMILGLVLALMAGKFAILMLLGLVFKLARADLWLFGLSLAQAGEFGFVLLNFSTQNAVLGEELADWLSLIIALSMLFTPALFIFFDKVIAHRITVEKPPEDTIDRSAPVIIAGLGRFGQVVNRLLMSQGHRTVVLDNHNDLISGLRKVGVEGYFGDPSRPELLLAAGIRDAQVLIVALDDKAKSVELVRYVTREHPNVRIVARAYDRIHTFQLYAAGARQIVREAFDSSIRAGRYALIALGHHPFAVHKAAKTYADQDRMHLAELAALWDPDLDLTDNQAYLAKARELNADLNAAVSGLRTEFNDQAERAWRPPPKRERDGS